jgi:uncharacterized protein
MALARRMRSLPLSQIFVTDPFWGERQAKLIAVTLPQQYEQLVSTHRLRNFEYAAQFLREGDHSDRRYAGYYFNDSDVYKWLQACAEGLAARPHAAGADRVREMMEQVVGLIEAAQYPSGYISTFITLERTGQEYLHLHYLHELYCQGHLIEAAVAHFETTGSRRLLDVAIRLAEHIDQVFGPNGRVGFCGHQEAELALLELARVTHEPRYRALARRMVDLRGHRPSIFEAEMADAELAKKLVYKHPLFHENGDYRGEYAQDHAPIREQKVVVGHAVRAMYLNIAATDLADEMDADEAGVETAMRAAWANLTGRRMYVTGGIGPSGRNEGFTRDYDLPNHSSYAETCAAIGLVLWGHRLLEHSGEEEFAEIMELALYNGFLAGISQSGDLYNYVNPHESRADHERLPWYGCACCPPNIARTLAQIGRYALGVSDSDVWLHLPIALDAHLNLNGTEVKLSTTGTYPFEQDVELRVQTVKPVEFALRVRIPDWCDEFGLEVVGSENEAEFEDGYAVIRRTWRPGDTVKMTFENPPRWVSANPNVIDNIGRVALMQGPLVYCLESNDNRDLPQRIVVDLEEEVETGANTELGVPTLKVPGLADVDDFADALYAEQGEVNMYETTATFIPYFAWNDRGKSHMAVWVRR